MFVKQQKKTKSPAACALRIAPHRRIAMKILSVICFALCGISAWFFWGPALQFGYSLIPANAEYAWVGKIIVVGLVAYFGGIVVPFIFLFLAVGLLIKDN